MNKLQREIRLSYSKFTDAWNRELSAVTGELAGHKKRYAESYERLVSLNAWREYLLSNLISKGSLEFYHEGQNDALLSHVLASMGSWRSALKSLRSMIENICFCLYYMDHPVELDLWHSGSHRLYFSALHKYFQAHPCIVKVKTNITGLDLLCKEYSTLSRAIHGSGVTFRMTTGVESTNLWSNDKAKLGSWITRQRLAVSGLNLLLLAIFREHLQGNKMLNLRKAISLSVPISKYASLNKELGVSLIKHA